MLVTAASAPCSALILTTVATKRLEENLLSAHAGEGAALALGFARAVEHTEGSTKSPLQPCSERVPRAGRRRLHLRGGPSGSVLAHTFQGAPRWRC